MPHLPLKCKLRRPSTAHPIIITGVEPPQVARCRHCTQLRCETLAVVTVKTANLAASHTAFSRYRLLITNFVLFEHTAEAADLAANDVADSVDLAAYLDLVNLALFVPVFWDDRIAVLAGDRNDSPIIDLKLNIVDLFSRILDFLLVIVCLAIFKTSSFKIRLGRAGHAQAMASRLHSHSYWV